jgi:hypothetical protein
MSKNIDSAKLVELTSNELEFVSGGVTFNYSATELTYVQQKPAGGEPTSQPNR